MKTNAPRCTDGVDVGPIDSDPDSNERKEERKRIARELHDTLLQGLQGVLLEIEQFSQVSTLTDEQRQRAIKIEGQLRNIVIDGRDAISALRSPVDESDWMAVILEMGDRLALKSPIGFTLHIKGDPWDLRPTVRSEVLAVLREGLRNAFEHSHAQAIHVTISYANRRLRISMEDDGVGISEQQAQRRQKEGHWGMVGMRERSEKLGGRLAIISRHSGGTMVQLVVPRYKPTFGRHDGPARRAQI